MGLFIGYMNVHEVVRLAANVISPIDSVYDDIESIYKLMSYHL